MIKATFLVKKGHDKGHTITLCCNKCYRTLHHYVIDGVPNLFGLPNPPLKLHTSGWKLIRKEVIKK